MANERPKLYTVRRSIPLTEAQREGLRRHCARMDVAIGVFAREAALKAIDREDLSLEHKTLAYPGDLLKRVRSKPVRRTGARMIINLTSTQDRALSRAATSQGVTLSHLVREAALAEAGLKPSGKLSNVGRPVGH